MQNSCLSMSESWEHPQAQIELTSLSVPTYPPPFGPGAFFKLKSVSLVLAWAMEYVVLCPAWFPAGPDIFVGLTAWPQPWLSPHICLMITGLNLLLPPILLRPVRLLPVPRSPLAHPPSCSSPGLAAPWWSAPLVTSLQRMAMLLLMQSNMRFVFTVERVRCWLMLNLLSTRTFQIILYKPTF